MIQNWDFEKDFETGKFSAKWDGLTGNCPAMIRACEKDNFQMVSHFLSVQIQLENQTVKFRIDDSNNKNRSSGFYVEFRQSFAKETFSYDEYLKS